MRAGHLVARPCLGLIDFGCMLEIDDTLWDLFRKMDLPLTTGRRDERLAVLNQWSWITDAPEDHDRLRLSDEYADWCWQSRYCGGPFDFVDEADFRRGIDLFVEMVRKRYNRARACTPLIARQQVAWRSMLYQLKANIDIAPMPRLGPQRACARKLNGGLVPTSRR